MHRFFTYIINATMNRKYFNDSEWPYNTLAQFGLTREMIEDLPTHVLADLSAGRRSPVLPVKFTNEDGDGIKSHARFSFMKNEDQSIGVLFYPELREADLSKFDAQQQSRLMDGKAILAETENKEGQKVMSYVQIDEGTKQVLSAPASMIQQNMNTLYANQNFSDTEALALENGDTVTFLLDDEDVMTVGVDLTDKCGIRINDGDEQAWKERNKRGFEQYNFGAFGCWTQDEEGNLEYVNEEDYTEEMWEEQKKAGAKAMGFHR